MEERNKIINEENRQKIIEFEKAIKDAPIFTYNSNLFKKNAMILSDEERK